MLRDEIRDLLKTEKLSVFILLSIVVLYGAYRIHIYSASVTVHELQGEEAIKYLEEELDYNVKITNINNYNLYVFAIDYKRLFSKRGIFELQLEYFNSEKKYFAYKCWKLKEPFDEKYLPGYYVEGKRVDVSWKKENVNGITLYYYDKKDYPELEHRTFPNLSSTVYAWQIENVMYKIEDHYNITHEEVIEVVESLNY